MYVGYSLIYSPLIPVHIFNLTYKFWFLLSFCNFALKVLLHMQNYIYDSYVFINLHVWETRIHLILNLICANTKQGSMFPSAPVLVFLCFADWGLLKGVRYCCAITNKQFFSYTLLAQWNNGLPVDVVAPLWHIILIPSQPVFALTL